MCLWGSEGPKFGIKQQGSNFHREEREPFVRRVKKG